MKDGSTQVQIAYVITKGAPMGGSQRDLLHAAKSRGEGVRAEVVMGCDGPLADACRAAGIGTRIVPMRNSLCSPLSDARAVLRLVRLFRGSRPDIVHTYASKAGILGRLSARLAGVPIVVHTVVTPPYHAGRPRPVRAALRRAERVLGRVTDQFIFISAGLAAEFVRDGICSSADAITVPSAIDFRSFPAPGSLPRDQTRAELGISRDTLVVTCVAEVAPDKGHDTLLAAAERVQAQLPQTIFLAVGPGPLLDRYQQLVQARGAGGAVRFIGPRHDVPNILAASDLFVQASRREGLSRALVEAMYMGLPVVATNVGGTAELIRDGTNGVLVPAGDPLSLAGAVVTVLEDASRRARLGAAARVSIGSERRPDVVAEKLSLVYGVLLETAGGRTAVRRPRSAPARYRDWVYELRRVKLPKFPLRRGQRSRHRLAGAPADETVRSL